jgi:hypothetical protein
MNIYVPNQNVSDLKKKSSQSELFLRIKKQNALHTTHLKTFTFLGFSIKKYFKIHFHACHFLSTAKLKSLSETAHYAFD